MKAIKAYIILVLFVPLSAKYVTGQFSIKTDGNYAGIKATGSVGTSTVNPSSPGNYAGQQTVEVVPYPTGFSGNNEISVTSGHQVHLYIDHSIVDPTGYTNSGETTPPSDINSTLNTGAPCYKTPTSYGVTPQGAATYSVPIYAPPGTMGMMPNLGIVYNSMAQNGLLGYGWNLSGISSISRSGQSMYTSGQVQPITLTNNDLFTYNGNVLVVTNGFTNGNDGALYHTEEESFNQIQSVGTLGNGNGPDHFIVQTKDGLTLEFGNTTDSKLIPVGQSTPAVLTWMIDKITDGYGNYMTFTYNNDATGEAYIAEIDYTGNSQNGMEPYNAIKFIYDTKSDANTTYVAGASIKSSVVLNSIEVTSEGDFVKQYDFSYYYYDATTLLQSITEEGSDFTKLNPIQFAYTSDDINDPINQAANISYNYPSSSCSGFVGRQFEAIDFNGDGKKDLVSFVTCAGSQSDWDSYISAASTGTTPYTNNISWIGCEALENASTDNSATTFNPGSTIGAIPSSSSQPLNNFYPLNRLAPGAMPNNIFDFNGDGKEDLVFEELGTPATGTSSSESTWYPVSIYPNTSNGTSFTQQSPLTAYLNITNMSPMTTNSGICFLDLNGDHKTDVVNYMDNGSSGSLRVWFDATNSDVSSLPNVNIFNINMGEPSVRWDFSQAFALDLNGDQRTELVNIYRYDLNGDEHFGFYILEYDPVNTYTVGGNGTPDSHGNYPIWYMGSGMVLKYDNSGMFYNYTIGGEASFNNIYGDFNGDGISDVLQSHGGGYQIHYGIGGGQYAPGNGGIGFGYIDNIIGLSGNQTFAVDVNGDGRTDLVILTNNSITCQVLINTGSSFFSNAPVSYTLPITYNNSNTQVLFGDFNGDGTQDMALINNDQVPEVPQMVYFYTGAQSRRMSEAVNSYNSKTKFAYQSLTNLPSTSTGPAGSVSKYTQTMNPTYPLMDFKGPMYVTTQLTVPDEAGGSSVTTYSYQDGIQHMGGKGFIGFMGFTAYNADVNYIMTNNFNYNSTYFNLLATQSSKSTTTGTNISNDTYTYYDNNPTSFTASNYNWVRLGQEVHNDLVTGATTTTTYSYTAANDGNLVNQITTNNVATKEIDYSHNNTGSDYGSFPVVSGQQWWIANKPIVNITKLSRTTQAGGSPDSREVDYTYDNAGGLLTVITDPNATYSTGNNAFTTTTYTIDPNSGVKTSQTLSYYDPLTGLQQSTTTNYGYDSYNRFVTSTDYPYSESTTSTYDNKWGKPLSTRGADGLTTKYIYDGYGRAVSVTTPDGLTASTGCSWYTGGLPLANDPVDVSGTALYSVLTQKPGSPSVNAYYDIFDREVREEKDGFSNKLYSVKSYTARGNVNQQSNTYELASGTTYSPLLTQFDYNDDNTTADSKTTDLGVNTTYTTSYSYVYSAGGSAGFVQIAITTPDTKTDTKIMDPTGLLVQETDNIGNVMQYIYAQNGKLAYNQTASGEGTKYTYDAIDNPASIFEINSGLTTYQYNSIGQLITQTDANSNTYTFTYDMLGRKTQKLNVNECDANGSQTTPYTYTYYNTGSAANKLSQASTPCGVIDNYSYDNLGRATTVQEIVNGQTFNTTCAYDRYNNISEKKSPDCFGILYSYNSLGYMTEAEREDNHEAIWQGIAMNPFGQYTEYVLGTGSTALQTNKSYNNFGMPTSFSAGNSTVVPQNLSFTFDIPTGNLTNRIDHVKNMEEDFTYDNLDRLKGSTEFNNSTFISGPSTATNYDYKGNITSNSNAGTFSYPQDNYPSPSPINAVTSVTNPNGLVQSPSQNITYTPFKEVENISENGTNLAFTYGADMMRKETQYTDANNNQNNYNRYFSGSYERTDYTNQSSSDEVNYISCGGTLVAMFVRQVQGTGITATSNAHMYYVYTDHLGSILTLTDSSGNIAAEQNFDAWGNYRNPGTSNSDPNAWTPITNTTNYPYNYPTNTPRWLYRGYTGHEHLKSFGLINMNARLYDPLLGRMLSPDPMIGDPSNIQNYNMYSYCLNNPLKGIDPSGMMDDVIDDNPVAADGNINSILNQGGGSNYAGGYAVYFDQSGNMLGVVETSWNTDIISFTVNSDGETFAPSATTSESMIGMIASFVSNIGSQSPFSEGIVANSFAFATASNNSGGGGTDAVATITRNGIESQSFNPDLNISNLNWSTVGHNYIGLYGGPNNPTNIFGKENYALVPHGLSDFGPYYHDMGYEASGAVGGRSLIFDPTTIGTDLRLMAYESDIFNSPYSNSSDIESSAAIYLGIQVLSFPKVVISLGIIGIEAQFNNFDFLNSIISADAKAQTAIQPYK